MKLNATIQKQLAEKINEVIDGNSGDVYPIFIQCLLQKLRDNDIDKESTKQLLDYCLLEESYNLSQIYDKGNNITDIQIHELFIVHGVKSNSSHEYWKKLEDDNIIKNSVFLETKEVTYKMDSNNYIIVDKEECLIYEETINKSKDGENFRKLVLGAIPTNITIYKNPLLAEVSKYQIEWVSKTAVAPFKMEALPSTQIYEYLKEHNLVLDSRRGKDVLARILFAMERRGEVTTDKTVTKERIFYIPFEGKIMTRDIDIKYDATYTEEEDALDFLEYYSSFFQDPHKLGTILKWGWIAPFSFVIKQLNYDWMPWIYLYGKAGSGKTEGYGYPILYMYNHPDQLKNDIGGSSIDTVPRLGYRMDQGTTPILINEPGTVFKKPSTTDMIKNCVTSTTSRWKIPRLQQIQYYTCI